jgi:hypothetical protein
MLVGDSTALYWLGPNGFWKIQKTGGSPTNIPSGIVGKYIGPSTFAVTDTHFVWGENYSLDAVRKMPKTGVPDPTLIWQATDNVTEISQPSAITADDQNIYWVTRDYHVATVSWTISAYSRPIAGGPVQLLSTLTSIGTPVRIYPSADALLIVRDSASGGGISAIPKTGGSEVELISTSQDGLTDIFVKNDIMYILYSGVYTYDLNTGNVNTLIDNLFSANRLYVDDSHIYWTEANSGSGAVRRIPISGGTEETIYSGSWSWDISGDAGSIYWATGYEILSANK